MMRHSSCGPIVGSFVGGKVIWCCSVPSGGTDDDVGMECWEKNSLPNRAMGDVAGECDELGKTGTEA